MKRILLLSVLLIIVTSCAAADKIGVVYIGNSITHGALLTDPDREAPPAKASQLLAEQTGTKISFRNCGVSGATTLDFLPVTDGLFNKVTKAADELAEETDKLIISISLGTNDSACSGPFGAPVAPQQYYTNLKAIIDPLLEAYPGCRIVIQYPLWYSPNTYNGAMYLKAGLERLQSYMPMIDRLVTAYASSHPGRVYGGSREGFELFRTHSEEYFTAEQGNAGVFFLHPNKTGAEQLGALWCEGLVKAVGKNQLSR